MRACLSISIADKYMDGLRLVIHLLTARAGVLVSCRWQTHLNPAYVRSSEQEFSDWEIAVMILVGLHPSPVS
jgi:hypothetical protein